MDFGLQPQKQIFSVTQITQYISELLTQSFPSVIVEGEISNWKPSSAGHIYFTLKDANSQISAVLFKGSAYKLNFRPKDGDKVRCTGSISVYAPRGSYQIIVSGMELSGQGNILQMIEERKKKLAQEGLFENERKKPLPRIIKTLGVVTSPTGAAIKDIINVTRKRNKTVDIIVFPAIVQGAEAAATIVKMIEIANFYKLCDVLIVGRGGGSIEDLLPFSEESVVRAIAASDIPVISAVGHDYDWAISDLAADVRAATPSQAAEFANTELTEIQQNISECKNLLYTSIVQKVNNTRLMIKSFNPQSLELRFRQIEEPILNRFATAKEKLGTNLLEKIRDYRNRITNCKTVLENASPSVIFSRGYSMVKDEKGNIIRDSSQVKINDKIIITPFKGTIIADVKETKEK
ncbi:MAG: exodeoxyribonuclease VII large subunit [Treponema sp.]|nr:exodeoxyribonuclease VII large subunit [Treponema sp.]